MTTVRFDKRRMIRAGVVGAASLLIMGLTCLGIDACHGQTYQVMKVPLSGAAWVDPEQPPAAPVADKDQKDQLNRIEDRLKRIEKLLEDVTKDPATPPDKAPAATDAQAIAWNQAVSVCADCHGSDVAADKGDKFIMFQVVKDPDGRRRATLRDDFSRRDLRKMFSEVEDGTMPKKSSGKKLTQPQKAAFLTEIKTRTDAVDNK